MTEVDPPRLLRYSWQGGESERPTWVTYRVAPTVEGTRLIYDHTGFSGLGGLRMSWVLGRVRRRMLDEGLPRVLAGLDAAE